MQIALPPELEALVQSRIATGKYNSPIDVLLAGVQLLEQQEETYQGRLQELQGDAIVGWKAAQRGELVDGTAAMAEIRAHLQANHGN